MTKRPWRTKSVNNQISLREVNSPGECVSVDQMESRTPGFIAQLKGKLTNQRYRTATIFLYHHSDLTYMQLKPGFSSDETVESKKPFEAYAQTYSLRINHYHAENGFFVDNSYQQAVKKEGRTIMYCGVNVHFQNCKVEKRIRDLQEQTRNQLHHAKAICPSAVDLVLWTYALRQVTHLSNYLLDKEDASSPLERFSVTSVAPNLKYNHAFGCSVFALHIRMVGGRGGLPKWEPRSPLGINLGPSQMHVGSVSLVLNLQTAMVSPQFHLSYE